MFCIQYDSLKILGLGLGDMEGTLIFALPSTCDLSIFENENKGMIVINFMLDSIGSSPLPY